MATTSTTPCPGRTMLKGGSLQEGLEDEEGNKTMRKEEKSASLLLLFYYIGTTWFCGYKSAWFVDFSET